jgi:hypothetical protein
MTSKPMAEMMIDLGICRSHSRPRTSNGNPFSSGAVQDPQIRSRLPRPVRLLADPHSPPTAHVQRTRLLGGLINEYRQVA